MPNDLTVTPQAVTDTVVTVRCPRCDDLHQYPVEVLKPWPIRPGDKRTVAAQCAQIASRYASAGHQGSVAALIWGPMGAKHFTIKFDRQEHRNDRSNKHGKRPAAL